jgi:hypothetical protein
LLRFQSAEAAKSLHMYDPMTLSQTYGPSNMQLAQTVTMAPPAAEAKPAAAEAKATPAPTPAAKNDPAQDAALKKKWCVENVESTFFNADGVPRTALEQFSTFVNQICPQLEAEVPSKYRTFPPKIRNLLYPDKAVQSFSGRGRFPVLPHGLLPLT